MKNGLCFAALMFLLSTTGCNVAVTDAGPTKTSKEEVDAGKAEAVRAEIHLGAGELHLENGGSKLMTGSFRYSEAIGAPTVRYSVTGSHGQLSVESPKGVSSTGKMVNEWNLQMGSGVPLEAKVTVGAGKTELDFSKLALRSLEVELGAGELILNLAGKYTQDVTVQVSNGAGEARIRLPKEMGAVVEARSGLGGVKAEGMSQRDGKYYNAAYSEGKPAVRVNVSGGVGEIRLSTEN